MDTLEQTVRNVLEAMKLLDRHGRVRSLDSLEVMEVTEQLEEAAGFTIPTKLLSSEAFASVESIVDLLERARRES